MKVIFIIFTMMITASCGKKVTKHYHPTIGDDKLNDLEHKITLLEKRINLLEDAREVSSHIESELRTDLVALNSIINELSSRVWTHEQSQELNDKLTAIESLIQSLKDNESELLSICGTNEHLLKNKNGLYAVMQLIEIETITFKDCKRAGNSNQETCEDRVSSFEIVKNIHLAALRNGKYRVTDGSNVTFEVFNGTIKNCSNQ